MEFLIGLFMGYALTWPSLIVLLCLGIIFEANEAHGWAMFMGILSAIVAYFFFQVDPVSILGYAVGYIALGFIWSIWRYKRHAMDVIAEYKNKNEFARQSALSYLHPTRMLSQLTTWVLVWPFSMIENVSGDLIKLIQTAITKFFKGIYNQIYDNAVGQLMPKVETKE